MRAPLESARKKIDSAIFLTSIVTKGCGSGQKKEVAKVLDEAENACGAALEQLAILREFSHRVDQMANELVDIRWKLVQLQRLFRAGKPIRAPRAVPKAGA